jgi:hypothetical protein
MTFSLEKMNENILDAIQKTNSILNNKRSITINCVVTSIDPDYRIPNPEQFDSERKYRAALINFSSDFYFENINIKTYNNNKFYYSIDKGKNWIELTIMNGFYSVEDYEQEIAEQMIEKGHYKQIDENGKEVKKEFMQEMIEIGQFLQIRKYLYIKFRVNIKGYRTIIYISNDNYMIDFTKDNTFSKNLGFNKEKLGKGRHISKNRLQITEVKRLNFHCDLITGGYDNYGKKSDIIFSVPLGGNEVTPGRVISFSPNTPIFLPIVKPEIDIIRYKVTDQLGNKLSSEGEELSWCLLVSEN